MMDYKIILIFILTVIILYFIFNSVTRGDGITGTLDAKEHEVISNKAMKIDDSGVDVKNYSYSIWTYISDWNYKYGKKKMIISKEGLEIFFSPTQNDLIVEVSTFDPDDASMETTTFECGVSNIPVQKWVHIVVSIYGKNMDIYMNGKLVKTCVMRNIPKEYESKGLSLTADGGFSGYTAKFNFLPQTMDPQTVWDTYSKGWGDRRLLNFSSAYNVDFKVNKNY